MPRIRSIKPETFNSETMVQVAVPVRWTFAGLWTYCDDKGRQKSDPRLIKAALYPLDDDVTPAMIEHHLDELERIHVLCRYEIDGRKLLHVVNFHEHQHPSKPQPSKFPACPREVAGGPPEGSHTFPEPFREQSRNGQGVLPVGVVEGGEEEGEGDTPTAPAKIAGSALATVPSETDNQRAQRLTKTYTDLVPMSRFPAVMGIVRQAIRSGYDDGTINAALTRLAHQGRPVTVDVLRIEIEGLPAVPGGSARKREGDRILEEAMWRAQAAERNAS